MEAIATLIQDDPYLKLSAAARLTAYKARRARFEARGAKDTPLPVMAPEPDPEPVLEHVELIQSWIDRQRQIHQAAIDIRADAPLPTKPSVVQIQRVCAEHFNFYVTELCSQRRLGPLVRARQIAMYLTKTLTNRSLPEIGRRFGHRDHTTVLHAVRKIETRMEDDADLAHDIRTLKQKLERAVA